MLEMKLHQTSVKNIPLIELYREGIGHQRVPIVLLYHGFTSSKERKLEHAYLLAQAGLFVVLPDAVRHGDREDEAFAALSFEQKAEFLFEIVQETARETELLLEHYRQQSWIDTENSGIIGTSMGGMILFEYLANGGLNNIKTGVSIISTPDFGSVIDRALEEYQNNFRRYPQSEITRVKNEQPLPRIRDLRNFPLLLLNAEDDPTIPFEPVRELYDELYRKYEQKDLVKMRYYRHTGHETTAEMMRESVRWMSRRLLLH
ncbi:MAG TPA: alpha/beta hydrolase [Sediminispirochaeta sp.]|nr:alpha/beta hydrolase [Sediminispirochaeta sp.]